MSASILFPTLGTKPRDIEGSLLLYDKVVAEMPDSTAGLMLVIRDGIKGVTGEAASQQIQNLQHLKSTYKGPVVVMLSNMPLHDINFLHNGAWAEAHVQAGVDFAASLPIGDRKVVTFHLNTLVPKDTVGDWSEFWDGIVAPRLKRLAQYAERKDVELKVEVCPWPEFGDSVSVKSDMLYQGVRLEDLRNVFPLAVDTHHLESRFSKGTSWHPIEYWKLRRLGLGICFDCCHAATVSRDDGQFTRERFEAEYLGLENSDIVHLNDGRGSYAEGESAFDEGVELGDGEISNLISAIDYFLGMHMTIVVEINETDYMERPSTRKAIDTIALVQRNRE